MLEGEGDKKDTTKKSALEEIKGVISDFATEIGDALATNINPDRMLEKLFEVDDAAKAIAKSFGTGTDNIVNLKMSMTNAVTEVTKLGGNFEKIAQIQQTVGESVGRNVVIASEAYAKLYAAGEVSGKQAAEFVPKFKDVGISIYQAGTQMEKIVNTAREIGVNVGTVTGEVMKHMDKLNLITFQGGVEGFADLGKDFVKLNEKGQFEIIKGEQRRLKEVAKELGMMPAEFAKMAIGAKELEDKLQKIKFPDTITEEQKQFIANMAEMNEKGEYVISYEGKDREVNDLMKEFGGDQAKLAKFMEDSKPKTMEDLATQQLTTLQGIKASIDSLQDRGGYAFGGSEVGQDAIEAVVAGYKKTADAFDEIDIKGMRKIYDEGATDFVDTLNRVIRGEDSVEAVFKSMTGIAKQTSEFLEKGFNSAIESAKNSTLELSTSQNKFAQLLTTVTGQFAKNEGMTGDNQSNNDNQFKLKYIVKY